MGLQPVDLDSEIIVTGFGELIARVYYKESGKRRQYAETMS